MMANELLGYPAIHSHKITVGLISDKPRGPRGIYRKSWLGPVKKTAFDHGPIGGGCTG